MVLMLVTVVVPSVLAALVDGRILPDGLPFAPRDGWGSGVG